MRLTLNSEPILEIGYAGAGVLDQSSSKAMIACTWAAIEKAVAAGAAPSIQAQFAKLLDPANIAALLETRPEYPAPGERAGSYLLDGAGVCMAPIVLDGDKFELDPAQEVRPGDLCTHVSRFAFFPKTALYLGRQPVYEPIPHYREQPDALHVFFQRDPLTVLAVADFDLVAMHRVSAVLGSDGRREPERWCFDVRRHPDLGQIFAVADETPYRSSGSEPLSLICHGQFVAYFERLGELILKEQG